MTRFGYVMLTYVAAMGVAVAAVIPTSTRLVSKFPTWSR
jgi:hypothetical protein